MTTAELAPCQPCASRGQIAPGTACPVCHGTGASLAAEQDAWRERGIAAAVAAYEARLRQQGTADSLAELRGTAQAAADARDAARRAALAASEARGHAAVVGEARRIVYEAQAAAEATRAAAELAAAPPDPTDPPPNPSFPAGFGAGDLFYHDSLLVGQLDVWRGLTLAGGAGSLMTNPMTTAGDLIDGGAAGTPQRLGVGGNGQVLTVVAGVPAWANSAAGFSNPMTTAGDLITGGAAGSAQRLGVGLAGQVLTVSAGVPAWANSAAGFSNPMTTTGDLITGTAGGAAARLAIGATNQVLTVSGGVPVWANSPAGFTNPMSAAGDLILGTVGGAAIRLPVGSAGTVLQVGLSGLPAWTALRGVPLAGPSTSQPTVWLLPNADILVIPLSTYSLSGDDAAWINTAYNTYCPQIVDNDTGQTYIVGTVKLIPSIYSIQSQITKPPAANLDGDSGTWLMITGNITGVYSHFPATPGTTQHNTKGGTVSNLVIDGTNAGAAAIGLDIGDGWGHKVYDCWIQNFTGTSAIGLSVANRQFYTEKLTIRNTSIINNTTCVQHWAPVGGNSQEYNYLEYFIWVLPNQNGVIINGVTLNGQWYMNGNIKKGEGLNSLITFQDSGGNAGMYHGLANISVETNNGTGSNLVAAFMTFTAADQVFYANGYLRYTGGSVVGAVAGNIQFRGTVNVTNNSFQAVTTPTFVAGTPITNNQNDALVCVAGGTVSAILINGTNTGQTSGVFPVPMNGTIQVNATVAPTTWQWISAL